MPTLMIYQTNAGTDAARPVVQDMEIPEGTADQVAASIVALNVALAVKMAPVFTERSRSSRPHSRRPPAHP